MALSGMRRPAELAIAAAAFALIQSPAHVEAETDATPRIRIVQVNPWTHLDLRNDPHHFQFAIVTDRTGGHREGVFPDAVRKLNLLQPEFVMSVGDLIEGYTQDRDLLEMQWDEFVGFVESLELKEGSAGEGECFELVGGSNHVEPAFEQAGHGVGGGVGEDGIPYRFPMAVDVDGVGDGFGEADDFGKFADDFGDDGLGVVGFLGVVAVVGDGKGRA